MSPTSRGAGEAHVFPPGRVRRPTACWPGHAVRGSPKLVSPLFTIACGLVTRVPLPKLECSRQGKGHVADQASKLRTGSEDAVGGAGGYASGGGSRVTGPGEASQPNQARGTKQRAV